MASRSWTAEYDWTRPGRFRSIHQEGAAGRDGIEAVTSRRKLRQPGRQLTQAGLVALLVFGVGLGAFQKWPGLSWWAVVATAALAGFVAGAVPLWQGWRERSASRSRTVRRSVA